MCCSIMKQQEPGSGQVLALLIVTLIAGYLCTSHEMSLGSAGEALVQIGFFGMPCSTPCKINEAEQKAQKYVS